MASPRIQKRVAMNAAKPGKAGILKPWNAFENISLSTVLHFGLKADDVVKRAHSIVAAQLHDSMGLHIGLMRVGQTNRLHRPVSQGFSASVSHDFNGQAALKIFHYIRIVLLSL